VPRFTFEGKTFDNPAELAVFVLGGKWKMPILWRLRSRPWRYSELHKELKHASHKMLAQQLRDLDAAGLITRDVYTDLPVRVEYSITSLGMLAVPVIEAVRDWGAQYRRRRGG
jgi:DNA-binding HxlR family transcriptional regulator